MGVPNPHEQHRPEDIEEAWHINSINRPQFVWRRFIVLFCGHVSMLYAGTIYNNIFMGGTIARNISMPVESSYVGLVAISTAVP